MIIGGNKRRVIQEKNITKNDKLNFSATYKQHYIEVHLHKKEFNANAYWTVEIWHYNGGYACDSIVQRCTIRDAISYGLDGAML